MEVKSVLFQEYLTRLIADVVTGKLDVARRRLNCRKWIRLRKTTWTVQSMIERIQISANSTPRNRQKSTQSQRR